MNPFILALMVRGQTVQIHQHAAYQVAVSLGAPFTSVIDGTVHNGITGFIIKPQVAHLCTVFEQTPLILINVEPYSRASLQLMSLFEPDQDIIVLPTPADVHRYFAPFLHPNSSEWPLDIAHFLTNTRPNDQIDQRVQTIIRQIETHSGTNTLTPKVLADQVFLSPSRMAALFKQETGSSVSKYLLWTRLRQAIVRTLTDRTRHLTEIAYETGFYDQAQLNKYMYEMLGVSPRALKQNSDLIQVL
ncbi:AraC family transcriptional regulator [Fibrella sp. USSR17]